MRDLFEAIEQLSALLSMRIEHAARKRGWPVKATGRPLTPARGRLVHLTYGSLLLPRGEAATFVPRTEPEPGADLWLIDIRRSDGVMRRSWADGVQVGRLPDGRFALLQRGELLKDEAIDQMLEDLSKPGPSGVALWVRKVWGVRFGRMSIEVSDLLERIQDPDRIDRIHAAVLRATDRAEAEAQVGQIAAG